MRETPLGLKTNDVPPLFARVWKKISGKNRTGINVIHISYVKQVVSPSETSGKNVVAAAAP